VRGGEEGRRDARWRGDARGARREEQGEGSEERAARRGAK